MKRREFVGIALGLTVHAFQAAARQNKQYVCPPCGCPHDGQVHEEPGKCPVCGMGLVDKASVKDLAGIPNFFKVNNQVWTGGQPAIEHLAKLKEAGVNVVINLRSRSESDNLGVTEALRARELGLAYFNIPVVFGDLRPEAAAEFLKITDNQLKNGPVFIHCAAAIRVGGFWLIRRVMRDGWEFDKALQEANQIGLGNQPELVKFARDYIAKNKNK